MVGDSGYSFHDTVAGVMGSFDSATTLEHATKDKKLEAEKLKLLQGKKDDKDPKKAGDKKEGDKKDDEEKDKKVSPPGDKPGEGADEDSEEKDGEDDDEEDPNDPSTWDSDFAPGTNHTVCAPQLLHFTLEGRPLWFNGWISESKGQKKEEVDPSAFMVFMEEPRDRKESWKIHGANVCCLTAEDVNEFTEKENEVIETIIGLAKQVNWD
jgi:hypothetical protein